MAQLHSTLGEILLAVVGLFTVGAAVVAKAGRGYRLLDRARLFLTLALGTQVVVGAAVFASGARPAETLHILYGGFGVATLPAAATFAQEAPPRARAWVLSLGGLITLALTWRLASTG